jgi:hypothetical protein
MSLFKKDPAMAEPTVTTGTDVLRQTVKARNRSPHALSLIASEIAGVGVSTLEDFAAGKIDLKVETLQALTRILYPHAEFDAERDLLCSANKQEAKPMCTAYPARFDPKSSPHYMPFNPDQPRTAPQPVKAEPPKPKASRPGWASWW